MKVIYIQVALLLIQLSVFSQPTPDERKKDWTNQVELFSKKAEKIANDSLRLKLEAAAIHLFQQEQSELQKQLEPEYTRNRSDPYFLTNNYDSYIDLANNYMESQLFIAEEQSPSTWSVSTIEPLSAPFDIKTSWLEMTFEDQSTCSILPEDTQSTPKPTKGIRVVESTQKFWKWISWTEQFKIHYADQTTMPRPTFIKAQLEAELPGATYQFHFKKKDIGKIKTQNGVQVKLLQMENTYVEIELTTPEPFNQGASKQYNLRIEARDKASEFIFAATGRIVFPFYKNEYHALYNELVTQTNYTSEFVAAFLQKYDMLDAKVALAQENQNPKKHYQFQQFSGKVEDVFVTVYDYSTPKVIRREISYPIATYIPDSITELQTDAAMYDWRASHILNNKPELSKRKLSQTIRVKQKTYNSGERVVLFEYPYLLSSGFFNLGDRYELKEISFLNSDKEPINIDAFNTIFGGNELYKFYKGFEYAPQQFPEIPYYAKGTMVVNLAVIEKEVYMANQLPPGIELSGNALLIQHGKFNGDKYEVFVKDSTNRYLIQVQEYSEAWANKSELYELVNYYYGTPHTVEIYRMKGVQKADYRFNVKLKRESNDEQWQFDAPYFIP